ncbi:hypothetical protein HHK36_002255 [Tetracentron sinense]|uniref:DNA topoisomerase (ATP-hydrolyzing) n=1 Tax=Tetracentron sinense TaxID=13715 RepID=A0A834ZYQ0_TETSI|nr:hypothetical protein HHK36_002255 [Tetracentron sinense]
MATEADHSSSSPSISLNEESYNPYYFHNGDNPGLVLVSQPLDGENYPTWSRSMLMAMTAKNKLGFLDGSPIAHFLELSISREQYHQFLAFIKPDANDDPQPSANQVCSSIGNQDHLFSQMTEFTRSLIEDICNGRPPSVSLGRYRNYCADPTGNCCCSSDSQKGKEILSLQRECHAYRMDVLLKVLLIVQQLLQENKHGSKRDIYYMHPSAFSEQAVVDRAINDICILLECSRHNLNVVSVGNGLVMGWLRFLEAGRKFDCINNLNTAHPVPVHVEKVKDIISVAEYILVVEKEAVFQRLANDQFCDTNRCIIITGRGYPDVPTRRFLRLLIETLHLPAYCLVDCDPYGFDILTTYRFGSMIRWLGAFPSDVEKYHLPERCLLPLTTEDKRKAEAMSLRCYLQREVPQWRSNSVFFRIFLLLSMVTWTISADYVTYIPHDRSELDIMLQRGVKFEIEALSVSSISFLSEEYIPSKIQGGVHI